MSIAMMVTDMMTRNKISKEQGNQQEIQFPVTTAQVLHVARKLAGHRWTTKDIADHLGVSERKVRVAVFWLAKKYLIAESGDKKHLPLPEKYRRRTYDVNYYMVTDAGMAYEFVTSPRGAKVERFGDVAALEMALGFCRALSMKR